MRALLLAALFVSACGSADAASARGQPLASSITITPAPRALPSPTPAFAPGHDFTGGRIVEIAYPLFTLSTYTERDGVSVPVTVLVDASLVRAVWRETFVSAAALAVGDEVFVSGSGGTPFVATTIDANIGRLDGTITSIDGGVITFEALLHQGGTAAVKAELSPFIVQEGPWRLSDLRPGMTIGAVVYWDRVHLRRITRIW